MDTSHYVSVDWGLELSDTELMDLFDCPGAASTSTRSQTVDSLRQHQTIVQGYATYFQKQFEFPSS